MNNSMNNGNEIKSAGLGARLGAFLLDALIVSILYFVIAILITLIGDVDKMLVAFSNYKYASVFFPYRLLLITYTLVWFTYSTIMEAGAKESTWGKRVAKIRVVYKDGTKAKGLDIVVRNIIKYLPRILPSIFFGHFPSGLLYIIYIIYLIIILFNNKHRGIYDFIGGTMVIREKTENSYVSSAEGPMMQNVIIANNVQPQRPVNVPMQGQSVNITTPQRPVSVPVATPSQSVNIQTPQRPVNVSAPGGAVNIQIPQRPVSVPVATLSQSVNIQTPQRPVNVSAPGDAVNIQIPQRPVSAPVATPSQSVNIQTPQRPVNVSAPGGAVNIQIPVRPEVKPVEKVSEQITVNPVVQPADQVEAMHLEKDIEQSVEKAVEVPSKLVCLDGMYSGAQFSLDKPIIMGLDGNVCTLIFRNDTENVGKVHCRVELLSGNVYLEDFGSTYATYVNTKKLNPYEKVELSLGDCVKIGTKEIFILK